MSLPLLVLPSRTVIHMDRSLGPVHLLWVDQAGYHEEEVHFLSGIWMMGYLQIRIL